VGTWITNIGAGLAVLGIGLAGRAGRDAWSARRGKLACWWILVTYAPTDHAKSEPIWSLEVGRLAHRHERGPSTVTGTFWRVYNRGPEQHYSRRWKFEGAYVNDVIEGRYAATRDEAGSHGVFHVWETHPLIFEGKFTRVIKRGSGRTLTHEREEAWTEWAPLPDELRGALKTIVAAVPRAAALRWYPWGLRRRLGIGGGPLERWGTSLAAAAAPVDNRLLLESVRAQREAAAAAPKRRAKTKRLYRKDLGVFPEALRSAPPDDDVPLAG
jgi:hypothetical protein